MRMSAVAKHRNFALKKNNKTQQEKMKKANERYRPRLCCEKCKESKVTLYKVKNKYYCKNCIAKENR